ncbi:MAG: prepilin-type N-terminal cleavage/methylation domain-containing protein [Candidatus Pacebacteria bacterium]|nr:prepilin-type N-terminal cleavage/methylation domain-containing protein [Candidatus Paceibacterota bacterium]
MVSQNKTGFSLVELMFVVAIISLLTSVVLVSLSSARVKSRDAARRSDLYNIEKALGLYYDKYNTYKVAGTGDAGSGSGWLSYEGGTYVKAVTRGLQEEGFLTMVLADDPIQSPGYMIFLCANDKEYAISATLENSTSDDISFIQTTCNGSDAYSTYGKNYSRTNKN